MSLHKRIFDDFQETSTCAAIHKTSDIGGYDAQSKKKVRTYVDEEQTFRKATDKQEPVPPENCDPDAECSIDELYQCLRDSEILCNIKQQYNSFHERQSKTFNTDVCCYVSPSSRRRKHSGGLKYGDPVLPSRNVNWIDFEDPPVVAFDNMLFSTQNLSYRTMDSLCQPMNYFENAFAVLQGSYSSKASPVSICHLTSVCVNHISTPYYLQLDTDLPCFHPQKLQDNPYQYLFPVVSEEEANCEVVSVNDEHLKAEVLLLRTTRPVPIGHRLCLAEAHSVPHITMERGNGRKLTWFKNVCVNELVSFNSV